MLLDCETPPNREEFLLKHPPEVQNQLRELLDQAVSLLTSGGAAPASEGEIYGAYRLIREIGAGGMGAVWEAEEVSIGRRVALKFLSPHIVHSEEALRRFRNEARITARLEHPAIVTVFAVDVEAKRPFIAQELVENGRNWADYLETLEGRRELPVDFFHQVVQKLFPVVEALAKVHQAGVIHRDIKPNNLLWTPDNRLMVADFGLAYWDEAKRKPATEVLAGTPDYVSPEQISRSGRELDARSDIFSFGATLYETLTLTRPFGRGTRDQILRRVAREDPAEPRKIQPRVPRDLAVICMKCLEKIPQRRYPTMGELAGDLRRFLNHEPIRARPAGPVYKATKWMKRRPAAALFLIALPLLSGLLTWNLSQWDEVAKQRQADRFAQADRHLVQGYLDLNRSDLEYTKSALAEFNRAMEILPSLEGVMGVAQALYRLEGAESAHHFLKSQATLEEQYPDFQRIRVSVLRVLGEKEAAEDLLISLPTPSSSVGWFLEGSRLVTEGKLMESERGKVAHRLALGAFHKACLASEAPRPLYYFHAATTMVHLREPTEIAEAIVAGLRTHWPDQWFSEEHVGFALLGSGQLQEAEQAFRNAIKAAPERPWPWVSLGAVLNNLGRHQEAIQAYQQAIKINPNIAESYSNMGTAFLDWGKPEEALFGYRKALEIEPKYARAYHGLGFALAKVDCHEEAIDAYLAAIQLKRENALAHSHLGVSLTRLQRFPEAIQAFHTAMRLDFRLSEAYVNLGKVFIQIHEYDEAIAILRWGIQVDPLNVSAYINLAEALNLVGSFEEAIKICRKAIELDSNRAPVYDILGNAFDELGNTDQAIEAYRKAIEVDPEYASSYFNLGVTYSRLGWHETAIEYYRKSIAHGGLVAKSITGIGVVLLNLNRVDEACEAFRQAIYIDASLSEAHFHLGAALWELGDTIAALGAYEEAVLVDPNNAEAYYVLSLAAAELNLKKKAFSACLRAIDLNPKEIRYQLNYGIFLYNYHEYEQALTCLERAQGIKDIEPNHAALMEQIINLCNEGILLKRHIQASAASPDSVVKYEEAFQLALAADQMKIPNEEVTALWNRGQALAVEAGVELDSIPGVWDNASAVELNNAAWGFVDPEKPSIETGVKRGLAYAQAAVAKQPDEPMYRDTLAWALVASGYPEVALRESKKALELAAEENKGKFQEYLEQLTKRIREQEVEEEPNSTEDE
ncbi:MAG: tetratricopeptide repeat protein [Planctomycetota bacterium]|nr:MAG: tetratricopeptide repeat protein [Planctomycetota bacterium]